MRCFEFNCEAGHVEDRNSRLTLEDKQIMKHQNPKLTKPIGSRIKRFSNRTVIITVVLEQRVLKSQSPPMKAGFGASM